MSEEELDEIVQITVEDFNQDERTGKIPAKQCLKISFYFFQWMYNRQLDVNILFTWLDWL